MKEYDPQRRWLIKGIVGVGLLSISRIGLGATLQVVAVRVWPSKEYTRLAIESNIPLEYNYFMLKDAKCLVVDIKNLLVNNTLKTLSHLVKADDPYLKKVSVEQYKPTVTRLRLELKQQISPTLFSLRPYSGFKYRLVIDLYPYAFSHANDPIYSLIQSKNLINNTATQSVVDGLQLNHKRSKYFVIMLDPGHGGEDPGAIGHKGTQEKHIVLKIAKKLKSLLQKEPNIKVYMTREDDVYIPLEVRVEKARSIKSDLMISIHADAFPKSSARGSSVYALSLKGATSAAANYLAKTQNASDLIGGVKTTDDPYLNKTILDLLQTATIKDSLNFGEDILANIKSFHHLHQTRVDQAGFIVLKAPDIPSILVETAFISNYAEEQLLRTDAFQQKMANAILNGIRKYRKDKNL